MKKLILSSGLLVPMWFKKPKFFLFSFLIFSALSACKKDSSPPPSPSNCEQTGTIEAVPCGDGAWGNLYIRTSNGFLLKPCRVMASGFIPVNGMKIRFSAVDPNVSDPCQSIPDTLYNCFQPAHHDFIKVITCIKAVDEQPHVSCNTYATVKQIALDGCKWLLVLDNGLKLEPASGVPPSFIFRDGMRVRIGYQFTNAASVCMVGKPARILCIEEVCTITPECKKIQLGNAPSTTHPRFTITDVQKVPTGVLPFRWGTVAVMLVAGIFNFTGMEK